MTAAMSSSIWNEILQWGGVLVLFVFALGFTLGWFGGKKHKGCHGCDLKDTCLKNRHNRK